MPFWRSLRNYFWGNQSDEGRDESSALLESGGKPVGSMLAAVTTSGPGSFSIQEAPDKFDLQVSWPYFLGAMFATASDVAVYINQHLQRIVYNILLCASIIQLNFSPINLILLATGVLFSIAFSILTFDAFLSKAYKAMDHKPERSFAWVQLPGLFYKIYLKFLTTFSVLAVTFYKRNEDHHNCPAIKDTYLNTPAAAAISLVSLMPIAVGESKFLREAQDKSSGSSSKSCLAYSNWPKWLRFLTCLMHGFSSATVTYISLDGMTVHNRWTDTNWMSDMGVYWPEVGLNASVNLAMWAGYFLYNFSDPKEQSGFKVKWQLAWFCALARATINGSSLINAMTTIADFARHALSYDEIDTSAISYRVFFWITLIVILLLTWAHNLSRFVRDKQDMPQFVQDAMLRKKVRKEGDDESYQTQSGFFKSLQCYDEAWTRGPGGKLRVVITR